MKLHVITIVLDGMPWIPCVFASLQQLKRVDWVWHISHGVSKPINCTSWCKPIRSRLSKDGTTEFLEGIKAHPKVRVYEKTSWDGKVEMVNAGVSEIEAGDVVLQVDSDELWNPHQLETIVRIWECHSDHNQMEFWCRYFVGPNLILKGDGYGNRPQRMISGKMTSEWLRAWKAHSGFKFEKHEPPIINAQTKTLGREQTKAWGLVFDHYAYATEKQVEFKEQYYGYKGAVEQWKRLQSLPKYPVVAREYLEWIDSDNVEVIKLHE